MIGLIHHSLKVMVLEISGQELWEKILRENSIDVDIEFKSLEYYSDEPLIKLIVSLAAALEISVDDCLYKFGAWIIPYLVENGYREHISSLGDNLKDFLININPHHIFINQYSFKSKLVFPQFNCEANPDGTLTLHYFSRRVGLGAFMKGIVAMCAEILFQLKLEMTVVEVNSETNLNQAYQHVKYNVKSLNGIPLFYPSEKKITFTTKKENSNILTMKDFCQMSPTHICFDKKMLIDHCGEFLQQELGFSSKHPKHLATLFEIIQPDFEFINFKSITKNINAPYMFRLKKNMKRNQNQKSYDNLLLIGQMYLINNGENLLFINSPYITTAIELKKTNMYISDIAKSDSTRDLIMLNQTRLYQNNANAKLEESMKSKTDLAVRLDIKRAQANDYLLDTLPISIVEKQKVDPYSDFADDFSDVTCMIATLSYFEIIYKNCSAKEVLKIITEIFESFERLIEVHQCQKVSRSIDTLYVVAGMPMKLHDHASRILNLAIGFMFEAKQIIVPGLNLPLIIRIVVHTGSVTAGLVGDNRLRYYVFGDGFEVPKKLLELDGLDKHEQIIVTNSTKQSASKSQWDGFEFVNLGYKQVRKNHATCTFKLVKNAKKTVWDIIQLPKAENKSKDGYEELSKSCAKEWAKVEKQILLQKKAISIMQQKNNSSSIFFNGKKFCTSWKRANRNSEDSGLSIHSQKSVDSMESGVCSIM